MVPRLIAAATFSSNGDGRVMNDGMAGWQPYARPSTSTTIFDPPVIPHIGCEGCAWCSTVFRNSVSGTRPVFRR